MVRMQFLQVKDRKGNYRDIPGNWNQYAGRGSAVADLSAVQQSGR